MTLYVLDTDTSSYIIRERSPEILQRLDAATRAGHEIVISVITYAELMQGLHSAAARAGWDVKVSGFLQTVHDVVPWDTTAADQWARINPSLRAAGTPIGAADTMIAAHAMALGAVLITNNTAHFQRVEGLTFENWT